MKLWDHAYTKVFKGADAYKKSKSFKERPAGMMVVKCVIYRSIFHYFLIFQLSFYVTL